MDDTTTARETMSAQTDIAGSGTRFRSGVIGAANRDGSPVVPSLRPGERSRSSRAWRRV